MQPDEGRRPAPLLRLRQGFAAQGFVLHLDQSQADIAQQALVASRDEQPQGFPFRS